LPQGQSAFVKVTRWRPICLSRAPLPAEVGYDAMILTVVKLDWFELVNPNKRWEG
jgi:hypothetical protein